MRKWLPLLDGLPGHVHAAHRRHDRERRAARHGRPASTPPSARCSGSSTPTRWPWPRWCSAPARSPTSSATAGSTSPAWRCSPLRLARLRPRAERRRADRRAGRPGRRRGGDVRHDVRAAQQHLPRPGPRHRVRRVGRGNRRRRGGRADHRRPADRGHVLAVDLLREPPGQRRAPIALCAARARRVPRQTRQRADRRPRHATFTAAAARVDLRLDPGQRAGWASGGRWACSPRRRAARRLRRGRAPQRPRRCSTSRCCATRPVRRRARRRAALTFAAFSSSPTPRSGCSRCSGLSPDPGRAGRVAAVAERLRRLGRDRPVPARRRPGPDHRRRAAAASAWAV